MGKRRGGEPKVTDDELIKCNSFCNNKYEIKLGMFVLFAKKNLKRSKDWVQSHFVDTMSIFRYYDLYQSFMYIKYGAKYTLRIKSTIFVS